MILSCLYDMQMMEEINRSTFLSFICMCNIFLSPKILLHSLHSNFAFSPWLHWWSCKLDSFMKFSLQIQPILVKLFRLFIRLVILLLNGLVFLSLILIFFQYLTPCSFSCRASCISFLLSLQFSLYPLFFFMPPPSDDRPPLCKTNKIRVKIWKPPC